MRILGKIFAMMIAVALVATAIVPRFYPRLYNLAWFRVPPGLCGAMSRGLVGLRPIVKTGGPCSFNPYLSRLFIKSQIKSSSGFVPAAIQIKPFQAVNNIVLEINGGPGSVTLEPPMIIFDDYISKIENCGTAYIKPAYMGSYERSLYPLQSHVAAEREIGGIITSLGSLKRYPVHILAESLGGHIFSSELVPVPSGGHLALVPVMHSPQKMMDFFTNDPRYSFRVINQYSDKRIWIAGKRVVKQINEFQFLSAYFGSDKFSLSETFIDRWKRKNNVSPKARVMLAMARHDGRTGMDKYVNSAKSIGLLVNLVDGDHVSEYSNRSRFDASYAWFSNELCGKQSTG